MSDFEDKVKELNNTKDTTEEFDQEDIANNKDMSILAYLSILVLIPLFARKDSAFAKYHCNQGIILAIAEIIAGILLAALTRIPFVGWLFVIVGSLVELVSVVLSVIGILNAYNGKAKELPVIGKYKLLK